MPVNPNYDYDTQNADILRRQKIADAMQTGALAPLPNLAQMPSTKAGAAMSFAAPIIQALLASRMQGNVAKDRTDLTQRYEGALTSGMQKFYSTANGDAAAGTPGNMKQAIADAMASNHPVLRDFAMKQVAEAQKGQVTPKDLLPYAAPGSILKSPNDPTTWAPKENLGTVGEVVYDKDRREIIPLGGPKPQQKMVNGDLYEQSPSTLQWKKLDNAPKVTVGVNPIIKGQQEGMKTYWETAAKHVDALGQVATQAQANKQTIAELKNLDSQGIFSNAASGPATFLSNLAQPLGISVDAKKLGNTETYNALTTELWQGLVSKYGGNRGVTAEEAREIKKMLPLAANSPQARQQLFGILENASNRQITQYKNANQSFADAVKKDDPKAFSLDFQDVYTPQPNQPAPVTPKGPAKPTVSNW